MIAACRRVLRPATLDALFALLEASEPPPLLLAGGTDLIVKAKERLVPEAAWVDLTALRRAHPELSEIREAAGEVRIGALATFAAMERSDLLARAAPALFEAARVIGSPQIRSRGTLGGNLGNASPAGDAIPALYTLQARVVIGSSAGRREVPVERLFTGPGRTDLGPCEAILSVRFARREGARGAFLRLGQRAAQAISKVSVALTAVVDGGKPPALHDVRVALGAVAPTVIRATATEAVLEGRALSKAVLDAARAACEAESRPITDLRSTADYRREQAGTLLVRAVRRVAGIEPD